MLHMPDKISSIKWVQYIMLFRAEKMTIKLMHAFSVVIKIGPQ